MIANLLPLDAYQPRVRSWTAAFTMAIVSGVLMTAFLRVLIGTEIPLTFIATFAGSVALPYAAIWTVLFPRIVKWQIARAYADDSSHAAAPLPDATGTRVFAKLESNPALIASGHLYAGPIGLSFLPGSTNFRWQRKPRFATWDAIQHIEPREYKRSIIARLLTTAPGSSLRIATTHGEWLIHVPHALQVADALKAYQPKVV